MPSVTTAPGSDSERTGVRSAAAAYDGLAATYDDHYDDEVCAAEDRRVERALRPMVRAAASVLDVGCGTGWVLDHCADLFAGHRIYHGFDVSGGMLQKLEEKHRFRRGGLKVWQADVNASWGPPSPITRGARSPIGTFDLITSTFASPSYVTDVDSFLLRCAKHLNPGGRVFLMPHARGAERREAYMEDPDAYIGDVPWGERRTTDALQAAGFVDVQITGLRHPEMGPGLHRSRRWHDTWMHVEQRLFRPDAMSFLVVTARRAA